MGYTDDYNLLRQPIEVLNKNNSFDGIEFVETDFESHAFNILPGAKIYHCNKHNLDFKSHSSFYTDIGTIKHNVHIKDIFVEENKKFRYTILKPSGKAKAKKVTFLFHGFNEKTWEKYLPWAKTICEKTGNAIVLFPIAFHMQRAPMYWSSKREMFELSMLRKKRFPNIINSTLSNVAISMRLHSRPQRFIWSGLQTYYDIIQIITDCKKGKHPYIHEDFKFNIFAYSIGGFLAQILKLSNYKNYFQSSKICLFCSGATFNRLSPVSKFILDSEANVALYSFLVEHFSTILQKDPLLNHYINEGHIEGKIFRSMLDYNKMREFREEELKKFENHFYAVSLKKDCVIPPFEIMNTLKGAYRTINIKVDEFDFKREYLHENPFPVSEKNQKQIDEDFNLVFDKVCQFLNIT